MPTCSTKDEIELALDLALGELYVIDPLVSRAPPYHTTYFMYLGPVEAHADNVYDVTHMYKFLKGDEVVALYLFKSDGGALKRVNK